MNSGRYAGMEFGPAGLVWSGLVWDLGSRSSGDICM